jgi:ABC-type lipoprotein release transport system permease subunit
MVSLISVISTLGIALGVAVLIVGLSAMNGFERELKDRVLAVVPHGEIESGESAVQRLVSQFAGTRGESAWYCGRRTLYSTLTV